MRLRRYDDQLGIAFDLHPLLTVVRGLDGEARARFFALTRALGSGSSIDARGEIEVHGVRLALNPDTIELLELGGEIDPVLSPDELPGAPSDDDDDPLAAERLDEIGDANEAIDAAQASLFAAVDTEQQAQQASATFADRRAALAVDMATARGALDSFAVGDLAAATDALSVLARRRRDEAVQRRAERRAELEAILDQLISEVDTLRRRQRRATHGDVDGVAEALAQLVAVADTTPIPVPESRSLAALLASASDNLATLQNEMVGGRSQLIELTARRDAAYDALVAAERLLRTPELDADRVDDLEKTHDEIFDLDGRSSRLSAARLRRRAADLRAHEDRLLAELGFDSWTSYVMGVASSAAEAERLRRYDVAKATYEFAEDELAHAATTPSAEPPELLAAERRLAELREQAAVLLGRSLGPDPVTELREHTVTAGSLVGSLDDAVAKLNIALLEVGIEIDRTESGRAGYERTRVDIDELREVAQNWIDGADERADANRSLDDRHAELEAAIADAAAELDDLGSDVGSDANADLVGEGDGDIDLADDPEASDIRARIEAATQRVEAHRAALTNIGALRQSDEALTAEEASMLETISAARREISIAESALIAARSSLTAIEERWRLRSAEQAAAQRMRATTEGPADVGAIEWFLLARLASQRAMSFVGSLPLVIDAAFDGYDVVDLTSIYERLVRMSDVVQIIVCSDADDIRGWAEGLHDRAAVVAVHADPSSF